MATPPPLWKHQLATLHFLKTHRRALDFSDSGTGKSRPQLHNYASRPASRGRCLILCPKTLMLPAWGGDIEKFYPNLTASFAFAEQRDEAFRIGTEIVVMNHDGIKWLTDKKAKGRLKYLKDFDHLVIDEISFLKTPTAQRSKAMAAVRSQFTYRYGMSGTPNPNTVMELWHPTLLIDDGDRLGTSYFKLRNSVQVPTQVGPSANHLRWDDKPESARAIKAMLEDISIRHSFEEVMVDVPANHREYKDFSLTPRAKALYTKLENDCILQLKDATITAVHAAALRTKLLQLTSGAVYDIRGESAYTIIDPQRYELIADLVEGREHSVTFFNWKHQRDQLVIEFQKRGLSFAVIDGATPHSERDKIVTDYQRGMYRTLLLHPRTGAHGLTLTRGTTTIISSPIYEADLLKQATHRIYRGGQTQVTNTILIRAKDTVESYVYDRLNQKYDNMLEFLLSIKTRRGE